MSNLAGEERTKKSPCNGCYGHRISDEGEEYCEYSSPEFNNPTSCGWYKVEEEKETVEEILAKVKIAKCSCCGDEGSIKHRDMFLCVRCNSIMNKEMDRSKETGKELFERLEKEDIFTSKYTQEEVIKHNQINDRLEELKNKAYRWDHESRFIYVFFFKTEAPILLDESTGKEYDPYMSLIQYFKTFQDKE